MKKLKKVVPRKYKKEFVKMAYEYLLTKKDTTRKGKVVVNLPSLKDFAINYINVSEDSIERWSRNPELPEFAVAIEKIRQAQFDRLINQGLAGNYNSTIAKLMLINNHGYRDRTDVTTNDEPIKAYSDEQVNKIAERLARRGRNNGNPSGA